MTHPTRIPSDVNRPDRILGPFTARQVAILALVGSVLYVAWTLLRAAVPLPVFLAVATPIAAFAVAVAVGHRDGLPLDQFLLAAAHHHLARHRLTPRGAAPNPDADLAAGAPPWLHTATASGTADGARLGARRSRAERPPPSGLFAEVTAASLTWGLYAPGVVDLGGDGLVAIALVSTINLGLRTPAEQDALLVGFARYLHTLPGPTQILIRTVPLDLTDHLDALREQVRALPHPALAAAAAGHRAHLARLAAPVGASDDADDGAGGDVEHELLTRQVLLVVREPTRRGGVTRGGEQRLLRRLDDATRFLAPLDITVTPLSAPQITALLTAGCNPDHPHHGPGPDLSRGDARDTPAVIRRRRPERPSRRHPRGRAEDADGLRDGRPEVGRAPYAEGGPYDQRDLDDPRLDDPRLDGPELDEPEIDRPDLSDQLDQDQLDQDELGERGGFTDRWTPAGSWRHRRAVGGRPAADLDSAAAIAAELDAVDRDQLDDLHLGDADLDDADVEDAHGGHAEWWTR